MCNPTIYPHYTKPQPVKSHLWRRCQLWDLLPVNGILTVKSSETGVWHPHLHFEDQIQNWVTSWLPVNSMVWQPCAVDFVYIWLHRKLCNIWHNLTIFEILKVVSSVSVLFSHSTRSSGVPLYRIVIPHPTSHIVVLCPTSWLALVFKGHNTSGQMLF